jgi:flagellar export protein FliJ
MTPRTRLDKVVEIRQRTEDGALAGLARAQAAVGRARERLARAVDASRKDGRCMAPVELWQVEEQGHRRALQIVRSAENDLRKAAQGEASARDGYLAARQDKEIVFRVRERRRAEIVLELERRERRTADEIATLRFNSGT